MHLRLSQRGRLRQCLLGCCVWLLLLHSSSAVSWAGTFVLGNADGSFETGVYGMVTTGDVRLVPALGALRPTQGAQALLLTTGPDAGATPADATVSSVRIEHITIPAGTTQLRLDWNFLTNEFAPTYTDDSFTVSDSR